MKKINFLATASNEEKEIAENLLQTVSFLDNRNTVTRFLTNFEQIVLSKVASYNYPDYQVEFFGGYEGSERKKAKIISNEYYDIDYDIVCLKADYNNKFNKIEHRNVLGTVHNLGINFNRVGDIVVSESSIYIFVDREIADFIKMELKKIGRVNLEFKEVSELDIDIKKQFQDFEIVTSSFRIDSIVAKITNKSRSKIKEFLEQEFLISLLQNKPETVYKNFSKYVGAGKNKEGIKKLFNSLFNDNDKRVSKNKEEVKAREDFRTLFNIIFHIYYNEESKEYILYWQDIKTYSNIKVKLNGFDKKWYDIIFELDNDHYESWNYSSYNTGIKRLYNPDIKGMKEKYGKFYYNIILSRIPYNEDIAFLNKLGWTDYKDFIKGIIDIEKNSSAFADRVRYVGYVLQDTLMSENDLIEQLEEIMAINKKNPKVPINLCDRWLERLKSGVKVKEL